jgi:hypothetical protein
MVVLAYLWPLALVPFFAEKDDLEVQWHARHGLVLLIAETVLFVVLWLAVGVASLLALGLGCAVSLLFLVAWTVILLIHLAAILRALAGGRLTLPWISDYTTRF